MPFFSELRGAGAFRLQECRWNRSSGWWRFTEERDPAFPGERYRFDAPRAMPEMIRSRKSV
jgi:hypothetical protein